MPLSPHVKEAVRVAIREAKLQVVGKHDLGNDAHAQTLVALLKAFGPSPAGFLYVEPTTIECSRRPADLVLCHPHVGLLVVEVKGWSSELIDSIEAGNFYLRRDGYYEPQNPLRQAQRCMFDIKNSVERQIAGMAPLPVIDFAVAFPNITSEAWTARGFHDSLDNLHVLLADTLASRDALTAAAERLAAAGQRQCGASERLTTQAAHAIRLAFGNSVLVNPGRPAGPEVEEKLGGSIDALANLDKYFSQEQQDLARTDVAGSPRIIRGVAGSGKTIVLASMAARYLKRRMGRQQELFQEGPTRPFRVAVVCFNRSLVGFLRVKIREAFYEQTHAELPSGLLDVCHLNGLMQFLASQGLVDYLSIAEEDDPAARAQGYLAQLADRDAAEMPYDAIFVDEGQDFDPEEFRLLARLVRPAAAGTEPSLVIFYDDAQNLYGRKRPVWADIGLNVTGRRSVVMKECFRNTRQIVEFAFNVLLGAQAGRDVGTRTFADIAYLKDLGLVEERGDGFGVHFAERKGPPPSLHVHTTRDEELQAMIAELTRLIKTELVRPEDILVAFPRKRNCARFVELLQDSDVRSSLQGVQLPFGNNPARNECLFRPRRLTVSTVNGVKGYDSWITLLGCIDELDGSPASRAAFYVGATRAKLMLRVSGCHSPFVEEVARVSRALR